MAPPTEPDSLQRLIWALRLHAEASDRAVDAASQSSGLHRTDLRALTLIVQRQAAGLDTSPTDLARLLHLSSASTTALVDRLEANGHALRTHSTTDRRRVHVSHTPSAVEDGGRIFRPLAQHLTEHLAELSPESIESALEVLTAATDALNRFEPPPPATSDAPVQP